MDYQTTGFSLGLSDFPFGLSDFPFGLLDFHLDYWIFHGFLVVSCPAPLGFLGTEYILDFKWHHNTN